jgi:hypothetical protein
MRIPAYLELAHSSAGLLAASYRRTVERHPDEPDIASVCATLAQQCDDHRSSVGPMVRRYGAAEAGDVPAEPPSVRPAADPGSVGLLGDLQDLWMLASFVHLTWTVLEQAAHELRDHGLVAVVRSCDRDVEVQLQWLTTRIKQAAPQALIVGR